MQASTNFNSVHTDVTVIIVVINATRVGGGVEPHPLTLEKMGGWVPSLFKCVIMP